MKSSFKNRLCRQAWSFASFILAILTMFLLRGWLGITSQPLDIHAGWKPAAGWAFILAALLAFYDRLFGIFRPGNPSRQQPDPYTLAQAEIEAERKLTANNTAGSRMDIKGEGRPQVNIG